ncbi:EAL domain-containing protein [Petrocella sp. FN5]|uniref:EAL domain-containing protein n=1 Tax=Petrocella sp. FN5 TaxID=3032002 RepID=UPI0023DA46DA|nr:EAL domain-containing protein [Petrocella sp. FN5]MDF1617702.1 EAL domain-containing protein [Petrocella sp. FN5]
MINVHHRAILCVGKSINQLLSLEKLLSLNFGQEYVIEMAENSSEAMDIIGTLFDINIETSVLITDYMVGDMNGLELIHTVKRKHQGIKMILMANKMDIDFAQRIINHSDVYNIIKKPWDDDSLVQLVKDACHQYDTDMELSGLMSRLRVSEQQKSLILESISESIIYVNLDYEIQWKNSIADRDLLIWKASGLCYKEIYGLKENCPDCPMDQVLTTKKPYKFERKFEDDTYKLIRYFPVFDQVGQPIGMVLTLLDITEQKRAEGMSASLLEMSKHINVSESVIEMYKKAHMYLKRYFELRLMCIAGEDFDASYIEFYGEGEKSFDQKQIETLLKSLRNIIKKNLNEDYIIMNNNMGTVVAYPMNDKIMLVVIKQWIETNEVALKYINTIAEQVKSGITKINNTKKITYQAKHDSNTGLYNREYFIEQLKARLNNQREIMNPQNRSIALIDLNYFKEVNDNYSHVVGDDVLREIGHRLQNSVRDGDVVARMGGDEFAILFLNHDRREIVKLIKRLQKEIAMPIKVDDLSISVSSSIGIVDNISKYNDYNILLKEADQAMYEAKKDKSGSGRYIFYEKSIQKKVERHNSIELSLRTADFDDEMGLLYQPIIDLKTMRIIGFEGFLRWRSLNGFNYSPKEFIPIADESDEILEIGHMVMKLALKAVKRIKEETGQGCFISVNLTTKELMNEKHIDGLKKSIVENGIHSNEIQIDITDRFKNNQIGLISKNINELKDFGVHVNLDDFGTGYASLVILNKMDINEIKIDASYIRKIRFEPDAYKMVKTMINLAKSMEISVTAEGVEKKEELDLLCELGCDYAQGYYFSKPVTLDEAIELRRESVSLYGIRS